MNVLAPYIRRNQKREFVATNMVNLVLPHAKLAASPHETRSLLAVFL